MDDFFEKEITPFARVMVIEEEKETDLVNTPSLSSREMKLEWQERWKFIDSGISKDFLANRSFSSTIPIDTISI